MLPRNCSWGRVENTGCFGGCVCCLSCIVDTDCIETAVSLVFCFLTTSVFCVPVNWALSNACAEKTSFNTDCHKGWLLSSHSLKRIKSFDNSIETWCVSCAYDIKRPCLNTEVTNGSLSNSTWAIKRCHFCSCISDSCSSLLLLFSISSWSSPACALWAIMPNAQGAEPLPLSVFFLLQKLSRTISKKICCIAVLRNNSSWLYKVSTIACKSERECIFALSCNNLTDETSSCGRTPYLIHNNARNKTTISCQMNSAFWWSICNNCNACTNSVDEPWTVCCISFITCWSSIWPSRESTDSLLTIELENLTCSSKLSASRAEPPVWRTMISRPSSVHAIFSFLQINCKWFFKGSCDIAVKNNWKQRDFTVSIILWGFVVANINNAVAGGSSKIFNAALKAALLNIWTSSIR